MKPVHILRGINCGNDFLRVDLFGEGKLDHNTADVLISIELGDEIQQLSFAGRYCKLAIEGTHDGQYGRTAAGSLYRLQHHLLIACAVEASVT